MSTNNIAKWNGSSWLPLGSGVNGPVHAIALRNNEVFAGGVCANNIAKMMPKFLNRFAPERRAIC